MLLIKRFTAALSNRLADGNVMLRALVLSALVIVSLPVFATNSILVVHENKSESVNEIIQSLSRYLAQDAEKIDLLDIATEALPDNTVLQTYSTIITLGGQAAEITLEKNPPTQVLSLMVSKQTWVVAESKLSRQAMRLFVLHRDRRVLGPEWSERITWSRSSNQPSVVAAGRNPERAVHGLTQRNVACTAAGVQWSPAKGGSPFRTV